MMELPYSSLRFLLFVVAVCTAIQVPELRVTDNEIASLVKELRQKDVNRANSRQVELDIQGHTTINDRTDHAARKLFKRVDATLLTKSTFEKFTALLDNYVKNAGVAETETEQEKQEISAFIRAVLATSIWQRLYSFLHAKGHPYARSQDEFSKWIRQLWFSTYSRARGVADTSAFEHVFVGEVKNGEVSGMHSWIRIHLLEKDPSQSFDYRGYMIKRNNLMVAAKFTWGEVEKRSSSFLIGTSPEFDLALFTICFLSRRNQKTCDVEIDGCEVKVTSYDLVQNGKVFIGTTYPTAGRFTDSCRNFRGT